MAAPGPEPPTNDRGRSANTQGGAGGGWTAGELAALAAAPIKERDVESLRRWLDNPAPVELLEHVETKLGAVRECRVTADTRAEIERRAGLNDVERDARRRLTAAALLTTWAEASEASDDARQRAHAVHYRSWARALRGGR